MTDEINEAQNEQVQDVQEPAEVSPTQNEESTQDDSVEHKAQSSESSENEEQSQERKQTRSERRVNQLLEKLKEKPQPQNRSLYGDDQPLINDDELETGIDPKALEQRVSDRINNATERTRAQIKAEIAYENEVNNHLSDIDVASKDLDPAIEKLAVRQYEALNYTLNPYTGEKVFVPTVKFSEIVKSVQADLENITSSRMAQSAQRVAQMAQQSAVSPGQPSKGSSSLSDLSKNIWSNPAAVARELESRLSYSEE